MRRSATSVLALALVASAGATAPAAAEGRAFSFAAVIDGTDAVVVTSSARIASRCLEIDPAQADWVTTLHGTGRAGRLGRVTMVAEYCVDVETGRYGDGVFTLEAADGDVLRGVFSGGTSHAVDPDEPWMVTYGDVFELVDGGTGRFAAASGSGVESGHFNAVTGGWSLEMRGTIAHSRQ